MVGLTDIDPSQYCSRHFTSEHNHAHQKASLGYYHIRKTAPTPPPPRVHATDRRSRRGRGRDCRPVSAPPPRVRLHKRPDGRSRPATGHPLQVVVRSRITRRASSLKEAKEVQTERPEAQEKETEVEPLVNEATTLPLTDTFIHNRSAGQSEVRELAGGLPQWPPGKPASKHSPFTTHGYYFRRRSTTDTDTQRPANPARPQTARAYGQQYAAMVRRKVAAQPRSVRPGTARPRIDQTLRKPVWMSQTQTKLLDAR